jgi:hypothetical protein
VFDAHVQTPLLALKPPGHVVQFDEPSPVQVKHDASQAVHANVLVEFVLKVFDAHVHTPLLALKPPGHVVQLDGPAPAQVVQDGSQT